jgi:hypothetical protein
VTAVVNLLIVGARCNQFADFIAAHRKTVSAKASLIVSESATNLARISMSLVSTCVKRNGADLFESETLAMVSDFINRHF